MNKFYMNLPRNKVEFVFFMLIVSLISVNIIAPLITCLEMGFSADTYLTTLKSLPFIWLAVIVLVLITYKPASWMTNKVLSREDSFNAKILVNILVTVFMLSIVLTIVAPMIAERTLSLEPLEQFIYRWPRNFTIAFGIELLIAQPIARGIIYLIHKAKDKKVGNTQNAEEISEAHIEEDEERVIVSEYKAPEPIFNKESDDVIFVESLRLAIENNNISVSLLQRQFSVGYGRAKRLVDKMEELGYISKPKGEMFKRKILITKEQFEEKFGK